MIDRLSPFVRTQFLNTLMRKLINKISNNVPPVLEGRRADAVDTIEWFPFCKIHTHKRTIICAHMHTNSQLFVHQQLNVYKQCYLWCVSSERHILWKSMCICVILGGSISDFMMGCQWLFASKQKHIKTCKQQVLALITFTHGRKKSWFWGGYRRLWLK